MQIKKEKEVCCVILGVSFFVHVEILGFFFIIIIIIILSVCALQITKKIICKFYLFFY